MNSAITLPLYVSAVLPYTFYDTQLPQLQILTLANVLDDPVRMSLAGTLVVLLNFSIFAYFLYFRTKNPTNTNESDYQLTNLLEDEILTETSLLIEDAPITSDL